MIRKGTYILLIDFDEDIDAEVGALGILHFKKGTYCYVGSAMGGLDQRISRHLSKDKTIKWHIDHITVLSDVVAYESYPDWIPECELASLCVECGMEPFYKGFGCSDCDCYTHLFFANRKSVKKLLSCTGLKPFKDMRGCPE